MSHCCGVVSGPKIGGGGRGLSSIAARGSQTSSCWLIYHVVGYRPTPERTIENTVAGLQVGHVVNE